MIFDLIEPVNQPFLSSNRSLLGQWLCPARADCFRVWALRVSVIACYAASIFFAISAAKSEEDRSDNIMLAVVLGVGGTAMGAVARFCWP